MKKSGYKYIYSLISILLILGLTLGSFASVIYFIASSNDEALGKTYLNQSNSVEFNIPNWKKATESISKIMEILKTERLPYLKYISAISYYSDKYDVVGMYWNADKIEIETGSGEYITYSHSGTNVVTVSADIQQEALQCGDYIRIMGRKYEIIGLLAPSVYSPLMYDIRRVGADNALNMESIEYDKLLSRPYKAVIMPLDIFCDNDFSGCATYVHISFGEELSKNTRAEIEMLLQEEVGVYDFTDLSKFDDIKTENIFSKIILYSSAILIFLLNILLLISFLMFQQKRKYSIYKLYGATNLQITLLCVRDIVLLVTVCFSVGSLLAVSFINNSDIIGAHLPFTFKNALGIYLIILFLCIITSIPAIAFLSNSTCVELMKYNSIADKKVKRQNASVETKLVGPKSAYLLSFRYTSNNLAGVISIMLLSLVASLALTYSASFYLEGTRYQRYYEMYFPYMTTAITVADDVSIEGNKMLIHGENPTNSSLYNSYVNAIYSLDGVIGVGKISKGPNVKSTAPEFNDWMYTEYGWTELTMVNSEFCKYSPLPLSIGSWDKIIEYDSCDEEIPIPCILPYHYRNIYPIGTLLDYKINVVEDNGEFYYDSRVFEVVGICSPDALDYFGKARGISSMVSLSDYLTDFTIPHYSINPVIDYPGEMTIYVPYIQSNGKEVLPSTSGTPLYLLYSEKNNFQYIDYWEESLVRYGGFDIFSTCASINQSDFIYNGGQEYTLHAIIAGSILFVSVCSFSIVFFELNKKIYGVYYIYGMTWYRSLSIILIGNIIDMLIPAGIGAYFGIVMSQKIHLLSNYSVIRALGAGILYVLSIYLIVSLILLQLSIREKAVRMIKE